MSEHDRPSLPEWAEQDRAGDLAWIEENVHVFWPAAQDPLEKVIRLSTFPRR
jgi:hypothetical protein